MKINIINMILLSEFLKENVTMIQRNINNKNCDIIEVITANDGDEIVTVNTLTINI